MVIYQKKKAMEKIAIRANKQEKTNKLIKAQKIQQIKTMKNLLLTKLSHKTFYQKK